MTDSMSEVVERLAKAINPLAFEEVGAPQNKGPVMQGYYAVICNKAREQARAVLTELSAMGLVVVPREPTEDMLKAGTETLNLFLTSADQIYRAMLNASPKVQP
ncbi:MAG: hypothetical protein KGS44_13160 [Alphaproteobacteria bacterium]|nr:hypothetical protein [Alphaproteobacteria bacterium]